MNALNWFEIPATNFDRAVQFYEQLLQISMRREMFGGTMPNAIFEHEDGKVGGAVAQVPYGKAGGDGPIVYLNARAQQTLDEALQRVEGLGGKLVMPKTSLGPMGFIALIVDTEGNRVGLHCEA